MAINTPILKLVKPEITDKIDVSITNFAQNADKIDKEAKRLRDSIQALQSSLDDMKENMTGVQNDLAAVNQQVNTNITSIQSEIEVIKERLTALEGQQEMPSSEGGE